MHLTHSSLLWELVSEAPILLYLSRVCIIISIQAHLHPQRRIPHLHHILSKFPKPTQTIMTSSAPITHSGPSTSIPEFHSVLQSSKRILALCGAGLSAASGLDTFRGVGGMWRNHQATTLATPEAFAMDPGLVWLFYSYRRHKALMAQPNPGHYALAELSRKMGDRFWCISQNVDGESFFFQF